MKVILKSFLAGGLIALAGNLYLIMEDKFLAAIMFSFALYYICKLGLLLYTGKIGYIEASEDLPGYIIILLSNLIGVTIFTLVCVLMNPDLVNIARSVIEIKTGYNILIVFFKAMLCGMFMFLAVSCNKKGYTLGIIFGVSCFLLLGCEHSIADFAYSVMAGQVVKFLPYEIVIIIGNSLGSYLTRKCIQGI